MPGSRRMILKVDNFTDVSATLGRRLLQLETMLRSEEGKLREIADEYEDIVSALRQADAIQRILRDPTGSSTGRN